MNALRQFITATDDTLTIKLPKSYQKQRLEVIVLPMQNYDIPINEYFAQNIDKVKNKNRNYKKFSESMQEMAIEAQRNGLTEEILNDILNDTI